jgi:hypothetical protein
VETASQTHKKALSTALIPVHPESRQSFVVDTDTSNVSIGGVIISKVQDGQMRIITYYSETQNKAERNYCITRRELLPIVRTPELFHKYL